MYIYNVYICIFLCIYVYFFFLDLPYSTYYNVLQAQPCYHKWIFLNNSWIIFHLGGCVHTCHTISIHSSSNRFLACFHVVATAGETAVSMGVQVSPRTFISFPLGTYPAWDHWIIKQFYFLRNLHSIFHNGCYQFTFPPRGMKNSLFSTSYPTVISYSFYNTHTNEIIVVLICISLTNSDVSTFSHTHWLLVHIWKLSLWVFCPFIYQIIIVFCNSVAQVSCIF